MTIRGLLVGPWAEVFPRCIGRGLLLEEKAALRTSPLWLSTQCSKSSLSVINRFCNFKQKSTNGISSTLRQKDIKWNNFIGGCTVDSLSWIVAFFFHLALRSMKCQKPFVWVFPLWGDNSLTCANISETCLVPLMASCLYHYSKQMQSPLLFSLWLIVLIDYPNTWQFISLQLSSWHWKWVEGSLYSLSFLTVVLQCEDLCFRTYISRTCNLIAFAQLQRELKTR